MELSNKYIWSRRPIYVERGLLFESRFLKRKVVYDVVLPPNFGQEKFYPVLFMNDGQDYTQLKVEQTLRMLWSNDKMHFIYVGIHTNERRQQEYGVSGVKDYKGRGGLAKLYQQFVMDELLPFLETQFRISQNPSDCVFSGFSLGGLSALDIVWEQPERFGKVGVFSGSLWWRSKEFGRKFDESNDRIMHSKILNSEYKPGLKFWFECGTQDEKMDRNKNGIIDSIDDTLDLIKILKSKGYDQDNDITYVEVYKGQHNFQTWRRLWPKFLIWAFGDSELNLK